MTFATLCIHSFTYFYFNAFVEVEWTPNDPGLGHRDLVFVDSEATPQVPSTPPARGGGRHPRPWAAVAAGGSARRGFSTGVRAALVIFSVVIIPGPQIP